MKIKVKAIFNIISDFLKIIDSSKIFLILMGFVLTTLIGERLTSQYQEEAWRRDVRYSYLSQEIAETRDVLGGMNLKIENRRYLMQKIYWYLELGNREKVEECWSDYLAIIDDWNVNNVIFRNKVKRLIGNEFAYEFLSLENGLEENATCVHSSFVKAHAPIRGWKEAFLRGESDKNLKILEKKSDLAMRALAKTTNEFIDKAYLEFAKKYEVLENNIN